METYDNIHTENSSPLYGMAASPSAYVETPQRELEAADEASEAAQALSSPGPASRAPDDVVLYIFHHLFSTNLADTHTPEGAPDIRHLRSITLVCKQWRNVVISMTAFWTKISLPASLDKQQITSFRQANRIQTYRSSTQPLVLEACGCLQKSMLQVLGLYLGQFTSLQIFPYPENIDEFFHRSSLGLLTNTTHLTFRPIPYSNGDSYASIYIYIPDTMLPRLTSINLESEFHLYNLTLPWIQLITLKIHLKKGGRFDPFIIFSHLERIEHLDVNLGQHFMYPSDGDWSSIVISRLRTISLAGYQPPLADASFQLLQQSNLPALEVLNYCVWHGELIEALNRPHLWSIVRLDLELHYFSSTGNSANPVSSIRTHIQRFEQLESFRCHFGEKFHCAKSILQALTLDSGEVLPRLTFIDITLEIGEREVHEILQHLPLLLQTRVSPVDVPANARKALRDVIIRFSHVTTGRNGSNHS